MRGGSPRGRSPVRCGRGQGRTRSTALRGDARRGAPARRAVRLGVRAKHSVKQAHQLAPLLRRERPQQLCLRPLDGALHAP